MNAPIGIFDSGIGGLTIANAISKVLPNESIVYFGDTAHLPYGDKSSQAIQQYSSTICEFLISKKCKAIVIACNSASSVAYPTIKEHFEDAVPIINVIDPVIDFIEDKKELNNVGVIGTKATINSNVYEQKLQDRRPDIKVVSIVTSLFAAMIEEGFINCNISKNVINAYLSNSNLERIQALILGCTHYPIISREIQEYYNNSIEVIDSASVVADYVNGILSKNEILNSKTESPGYQFYVSDYTPFFENITQIFFKEKVKLELCSIWE